METPSKEAIRKAKKSIANKKFRDSQKAEKESTDETESATSDSKSTTSSSFFFSPQTKPPKQCNKCYDVDGDSSDCQSRHIENDPKYIQYVKTLSRFLDKIRAGWYKYIQIGYVTCQLLNLLQIYLFLLIISQIKSIIRV